jgi:hypothetical protein
MSPFRKRWQKSVAPFILASWLFSIFASVAQACGLDDDVASLVRGEAGQVSGHGQSHNGASPACDKFCADDLTVLAKVKTAEDPPTGQAVLAPGVAGEAFPISVAPVSLTVPHPTPPPDLAINIRFVRLSL